MRLVSDLAYLEEERARDVEFSVEYLRQEGPKKPLDKSNSIN